MSRYDKYLDTLETKIKLIDEEATPTDETKIKITDEEATLAEKIGTMLFNTKYNNAGVYDNNVLNRIMGFAGEIAAAKYFNIGEEKCEQFRNDILRGRGKYDDGKDLSYPKLNIHIDVKTTRSGTNWLYATESNVNSSKATVYVLVKQLSKRDFFIRGYIRKEAFMKIFMKDYDKLTSFFIHDSKLLPARTLKNFILRKLS